MNTRPQALPLVSCNNNDTLATCACDITITKCTCTLAITHYSKLLLHQYTEVRSTFSNRTFSNTKYSW